MATGREPLSVAGLAASFGASARAAGDGLMPVSVDNLKASWDAYRAKNGPAALTVEASMASSTHGTPADVSWLSTVGFSGATSSTYWNSGTNVYGPTVNAVAQMTGTYDLSVSVTINYGDKIPYYIRLAVTVAGQEYVDERRLFNIAYPRDSMTITYQTSLAITSGTSVYVMGGGSAYNSSLDKQRLSVSLVRR